MNISETKKKLQNIVNRYDQAAKEHKNNEELMYGQAPVILDEMDREAIKDALGRINVKYNKITVSEMEWPYNLFYAIGFERFSSISDEQYKALDYVLNNLLSGTKSAVIRDRYENKLSMHETAKKYGITRTRIATIEAKALQELRTPVKTKILSGGLDVVEQMQKAEDHYKDMLHEYNQKILRLKEAKSVLDAVFNGTANAATVKKALDDMEKSTIDMSMSIEDLDLTVRVWKCLYRAGYRRLCDFRGISYDILNNIPRLGNKGVKEVAEALIANGIDVSGEPE